MRSPFCYFPTIISMSYITKDLGVGYNAAPSNKGKIEYHQRLLYVPVKHLKSRWIIIIVANPPKRDMNLEGSRKFLGLVVWHWKNNLSKAYLLLKTVIFHCHVSSLEGNSSFLPLPITQKASESLRKFAPKGSSYTTTKFSGGELAVRFLGRVSQTFVVLMFLLKWLIIFGISGGQSSWPQINQHSHFLTQFFVHPKLGVFWMTTGISLLGGFPHPMKHIRQRKLENHLLPKFCDQTSPQKSEQKNPPPLQVLLFKKISTFLMEFHINLIYLSDLGPMIFPASLPRYRWGTHRHTALGPPPRHLYQAHGA